MTEPSPSEPGPDAESARFFYDRPLWRRLYGYVFAPLLVGAVVLGIYTSVRVTTHEATPPAELLATMRHGSEQERWQAAFALTRTLDAAGDTPQELAAARALLPEIVGVFDAAAAGDLPLRRYLVLALGRLHDSRAVPALVTATTHDDVELVLNALAALAMIGDPAAAPAVRAASAHAQPEVRSTAAFALGLLSGPQVLPRLRELLDDAIPAVRWNAAFALARYHDTAGEPLLLEILSRGPLYQTPALSPVERREQFLNAIRAAGMVATPALGEALRKIAQSDEDVEARHLARRLVDGATTGQP